MTVQEAIQALESHGWQQAKVGERWRQFKHDSKPGTVTVSGKADLDVPAGVLRNLMRFAQIEEVG